MLLWERRLREQRTVTLGFEFPHAFVVSKTKSVRWLGKNTERKSQTVLFLITIQPEAQPNTLERLLIELWIFSPSSYVMI